MLDRVANWELLAPQTEEEYRESLNAVSLEIRDSHDILIANYHGYRVTRTLGPARRQCGCMARMTSISAMFM